MKMKINENNYTVPDSFKEHVRITTEEVMNFFEKTGMMTEEEQALWDSVRVLQKRVKESELSDE